MDRGYARPSPAGGSGRRFVRRTAVPRTAMRSIPIVTRGLLASLVVALVASAAVAQPRVLRVRAGESACTSGGAPPSAALTARSSLRGVVRVRLPAMTVACGQPPRFHATVQSSGRIVIVLREPDAPVACTCTLAVSLRLESVQPGVHPIEVRVGDAVVARGEVAVLSVRWPRDRTAPDPGLTPTAP